MASSENSLTACWSTVNGRMEGCLQQKGTGLARNNILSIIPGLDDEAFLVAFLSSLSGRMQKEMQFLHLTPHSNISALVCTLDCPLMAKAYLPPF